MYNLGTNDLTNRFFLALCLLPIAFTTATFLTIAFGIEFSLRLLAIDRLEDDKKGNVARLDNKDLQNKLYQNKVKLTLVGADVGDADGGLVTSLTFGCDDELGWEEGRVVNEG